MDNAPYHSALLDKEPVFSNTKKQMQEWLIKQNILLDEKLTKLKLWDIIKPLLTKKKKYVIDNILESKGYEVLRLPPYHCQYNPIEMAWGLCKNYYNKHITSCPSSQDKVRNLWCESLARCTSDIWKNNIKHCEKLINDDWTKYMGHCTVDNIPPILISLAESETESDDTE
jgi:transposase